MTRNTMDIRLVERICHRGPAGGPDQEAMDYLANFWAPYCHQIDDIIDGARTGPEEILGTFALAIALYSHPFFLRHLSALRQVALNVTSMYADSVGWEKAKDWRQVWADHHRHCGLEMVAAVAMICGGYSHARQLMPELRAMAWHEHHNPNGKPE
jgi:hypothetical protein